MSAIFGIIDKNGKPVEESLLDAMKNAIAHRATDGQAISIHRDIAFGHCRLYAHPQQQYEHQPSCLDNLILTADVRLDNRTELAKVLDLDHQQLIETSDDQLILMTYRKWGKKCVDHIEGEYAFAIWDIESHELFAAVDPIGFRPFFYYDSPDVFIFCSEIKGVVAAKPLPNYFEEESLIEYSFRKGTPNKTYNKEVFALCGGNTLTLKDGRMDIRKYWTLESTGKYHFKKDDEWYDCTRELVYQAIENRLNPDVPTGITLSGGLDSTSIACVLSELLIKKNKPLYAFSSVLPVDYKGIEKDERPYIEIVGKHCPNIIQTYVEAPGVGPLTNIEEAFDIEESFPNSFFFMDKALAQAAFEKNVRNLYNGFGGDYWISNKGGSIIYLLIKKGRIGEALRLIYQFSQHERTSFFHEYRVRYISHTKPYKQLGSFIKRSNKSIDWQKKTFLRDDLVQRYSSILNKKECIMPIAQKMKQSIDSGRIGRTVSLFYNRNGHFFMDSSIPLFDKDLMEFLYDVPESLCIENGISRNLLRSSMSQFMPEQICQRTDKLPYAPSFPTRVINEKPFYEKMAKSRINSLLCTENIMKHFDSIKSFEGFGHSDKIVDLQIAHVGIIYSILSELARRDYYINNH
jgi:asparagine synthase (glutamine-hydrolysing)